MGEPLALLMVARKLFSSATTAKYWKSRGPRPEHAVAKGFYVIVDARMSLVISR